MIISCAFNCSAFYDNGYQGAHMFERLQKPFLTVETGEAYQPIRLSYVILQKDKLIEILQHLQCCEKNPNANTWNWFWRAECEDLHFESIYLFAK